ncbi:MAG TPA: PhzF family phenazine biosynthesis protein [Magnetospirillaceae bacterium]
MKLPIYQVDAFTDKIFAGNPAAIVPLDSWLPDATMQAIAAENNLAETAFFVRDHDKDAWGLRWFTPSVEVDLCGHATLAAAYVLFEHLGAGGGAVHFDTRSGRLTVKRDGGLLVMDFPARPPHAHPSAPDLEKVLGVIPTEVLMARDLLAVFDTEATVRKLDPDMAAIAKLETFAVIVTAPGKGEYDFVSRFFAPAKGVPEDPVTGSAHCTLVPYWSKRLGKTELKARQVSARGGDLLCRDLGDRVSMAGHAALYLEGTITV